MKTTVVSEKTVSLETVNSVEDAISEITVNLVAVVNLGNTVILVESVVSEITVNLVTTVLLRKSVLLDSDVVSKDGVFLVNVK